MEILMKLKCSPSAPGSAQHSTLKVVDHHHQLQQHTLAPPSTHAAPPSAHLMQLHSNVGQIAHLQQTRMPPPPPPQPHEVLLPAACLEYATATMDCCSAAAAAAAQRDMVDLRYASHHGSTASEYASVYGISSANTTSFCDNAYGIGTPPCCSGIASYGVSNMSPPVTLLSIPMQIQPELEINSATTGGAAEDYNMRYEYHEPEENFVSIDDAKIKGFLLRIGQEEDARRVQHLAAAKTKAVEIELEAENEPEPEPEPVVFEIIELDDDEEREKLMRLRNQAAEEATEITAPHVHSNYARTDTKSPSISLIPKSPESIVLPAHPPLPAAEQNIIAQIELLDSSSEEDVSEREDDAEDEVDDEDEVLAATAVSCELEDDDDDGADEILELPPHNTVPGGSCPSSPSQQAIVILPSDDDDENCDFIDEQEEGVELRWDDLEEQKERTFFECFLCGKKVQSSYNLRRHMMIHTGERPFGCDMCDRRFREFSDLKKHRRRHANETNFVCMVCRVNTPTENDPTRCGSCDTKNGALITASSRSQLSTTATTPQLEERSVETPPPASSPPTKNSPARNRTPAPLSTQVAAPVAAVLPSTAKSSSTVAVAVAPPPLIPISTAAAVADTQHLLDTIPAVHRPAYNQLGVMVRREFPCPLCQRPFGTRHNLKRHFMIHTGEKPFACSKCRKPFREYSTLKKHMVTHLRDRWYKCLRCPQKFRDYLDYMGHRNTHPKEPALSAASSSGGSSCTPSPKKRAKSRYNDYDYDSNDDGDGDSTSAEDWLECCECGQRFTDIEAYTEHLKEHDPSLHLFECYICKESFEQRDELEQHVEEQHDDNDPEEHKRKKSASAE